MTSAETPEIREAERERRIELLIRRLPGTRAPATIRWLRRPGSRLARIPAGAALTVGGIFSFLPVLGLWMLPLGLLLLAEDIPPLRRACNHALSWVEHRHPRWMGLPDDNKR